MNGNPICSAVLVGQTLTSTELNFLANAVNADGSLALVGSTGGDQGAGTTNAAGFYVNGANTVLAAHKTGTTPSTNNTITVDPDLQVNLPSGYTYKVTAFLNVSAGGAGGINAYLEYLGTTSLNRVASVGRMNGAAFLPQNTLMQSFNYQGRRYRPGTTVYTRALSRPPRPTRSGCTGRKTRHRHRDESRPGLVPGRDAHPLKALTLLACLLAGCAACREHPIACGIVAAVAAGSIVASTRHDQRTGPKPHADIQPLTCVGGDCQ